MRILILLLAGLLLVILAYQNQQHHIKINPVSSRFLHPFDDRIRYKVSEVDPRFGLSLDDVIEISQQAADIWSQSTGKDYFIYDTNARLSIRLIYDDRQHQTDQRKRQLQQIDQQQEQWSKEKNQVDTRAQELERNTETLHFKRQQIDVLVTEQNKYIAEINQLGGADPQQRQQLEAQSQYIEAQIQQLQQEIDTHNFNILILNQKVDTLNHMNRKIDASVQDFNQTFQPRLFDKGIFNGCEIHVYEFSGVDDLRLTLAHEFGHALGLGHHNEPQALMFPMLKDQNMQNFRLHPVDVALLAAR